MIYCNRSNKATVEEGILFNDLISDSNYLLDLVFFKMEKLSLENKIKSVTHGPAIKKHVVDW